MQEEFYFSIEDFLTRLGIDPTEYDCPFTAQRWDCDEELREKYGYPMLVVKVDPIQSSSRRVNKGE